MSSNLITQMNASAAASSAAKAAREATAAREASEERLEGSGSNPFVVLDIRELESVEVDLPVNKNAGFWSKMFSATSKTKEKLSEKGRKVSVKRTDISFLEEATDDFGTVYTIVNLEDRCELDYSSVEIPGTLEENQARLNGVK